MIANISQIEEEMENTYNVAPEDDDKCPKVCAFEGFDGDLQKTFELVTEESDRCPECGGPYKATASNVLCGTPDDITVTFKCTVCEWSLSG